MGVSDHRHSDEFVIGGKMDEFVAVFRGTWRDRHVSGGFLEILQLFKVDQARFDGVMRCV